MVKMVLTAMSLWKVHRDGLTVPSLSHTSYRAMLEIKDFAVKEWLHKIGSSDRGQVRKEHMWTFQPSTRMCRTWLQIFQIRL